MLVGHKASVDPDVDTVSGRTWLQYADRVVDKITALLGAQYLWLPSSHRLTQHPWLLDTDVIQLYNTHGGYFSQWLLPRLAGIAPLVWRLSDQWAMTGHCAYSGDCMRWMEGCGSCRSLDAYPPLGRDSTAQLFQRKRQLYSRLHLTIVAPSSWIMDQAARSPLLGQFPIVHVPNGLDGEHYFPQDRAVARATLGLPLDAPVLLFAAHILDYNPRKGGDLLIAALNRRPPPPGTILALMGEGGDSWIGRVPCEVRLLGKQSEAEAIASCYSVADVVAIPSMLENLPNTLIESLACGRAVVAFDSGGMCDGIRHGHTGYLARAGDVDDLAAGISLLLGNSILRADMEQRARDLFMTDFTRTRELDRLESLYLQLSGRNSTIR